MRLRTSIVSSLLIVHSKISESIAQTTFVDAPTVTVEQAEAGAPADAPTEDEENLRGCRGKKFHLRDMLKEPSIKLVGEEYEASLGVEEKGSANGSYRYRVKDQAGPRAATCSAEGLAGGYPCHNVDLLSMLDTSELTAALPPGQNDYNQNYLNDIWGWTHPSSKREFSIVGLQRGTAFVEITDPYNPIYLGALPGINSRPVIWRDIKVVDHYALIVADYSDHGMQIFDLERLLTASTSTLWSQDERYMLFGNAHNIFVNEDSNYAYAVGSDTCRGGLHMIDMSNPMQPTFAGCFSEDDYIHDVQCVIYDGPDTKYTNKEICFCSNEDSVAIVDVTSKANPTIISNTFYDERGYTHQGWLTDDKAYFVFNDELDENSGFASKTRTHVMDVRNLSNAFYVGFHEGRTKAIDHNLYIKDNFIYQAHYTAGLNVLKIKGMKDEYFEEVGYFDTFPNSNRATFNSAWSTYPYHESGVVTISGEEQGMFVVKYNFREQCLEEAYKKLTTRKGKQLSCWQIKEYPADICDRPISGDASTVCPVWCTGVCNEFNS